ncbi:heterodisulfide reductase-related iron-sulfur binding cluster [uncultured Sneathiella sp.]|mgnify:FL=1|uniref:heterodisulfide reductase-related iron-sulfur binding cluster n=1 Tax=uncultured Sneathiella sp. TaxID=879315 RepID=UPI0030D92C14|tara:strand:+ start:1842 stop:3179 length:1338 start_codon:yes stop_codon:yes gene_type:complete
MREGSLDAPTRHNIDWNNPDFYDEQKLDEELRRVFDICHGCRRCFNLCDSFPRLFDLIDESETEELDSVASEDFKPVVDACTLCDMCFMTKCPYVPPHEFNLDFPHLMLRYRAVEKKNGEDSFVSRELSKTDRNGKLAAPVAPIANWATKTSNGLTRGIIETTLGIDRHAALPKYQSKPFEKYAQENPIEINKDAPAFGRKAVIYATCFGNYNNPDIGEATRKVLAKNGVETEVVYPGCCGMPLMEQGDLAGVVANAEKVSTELGSWIDQGYDVIALVSSCALMLKFEWPLLAPGNPAVERLSKATFDVSEYVMEFAKKEGIAPGMTPIGDSVAVHLACHARAQNMGAKGAEILRLIPDADVKIVERCSGHGGSWGIMKGNYEIALKVGKPAARTAMTTNAKYIASECPLAAEHLMQGIEKLDPDAVNTRTALHPIELLAKAYGL